MVSCKDAELQSQTEILQEVSGHGCLRNEWTFGWGIVGLARHGFACDGGACIEAGCYLHVFTVLWED